MTGIEYEIYCALAEQSIIEAENFRYECELPRWEAEREAERK